MSTIVENKLWQYPSAHLTEDELLYLLGGTENSCYARLRRAVQKGFLSRVKRGLYAINERLAPKKPTHPFELAQLAYGPSYISLESALSYHGLIPEAVRTITSVTIKRSNQFKTPYGLFDYKRLPSDNFYAGVDYIQEGQNSFLMASPWKALCDYVYCHKKTWGNMDAIQESLRIDLANLPKIKRADLNSFKIFYRRENVNFFLNNIPQEHIHEH